MLSLKNKEFYSELFKLSLPIALGSLVSFSISLSDNMIISRLGKEAASSVFLCNQLAFLLTMLISGVEATVLSVASRLIGAGKKDEAKSLSGFGVIFALAIALVFFAFSFFSPKLVLSLFTDKKELIENGVPFLRALGVSFLFFAPSQAIAAAMRSVKKAKIAFIAALSAFCVNLFLNLTLIFGAIGFPRLDILGAGVATLAARITEFLILFIYAFFIDKELKLRPVSLFKIGSSVLSLFFKNGIPLILTQLVWSVNNFFATALMGRAPDGVVAGLSAATALYNLSYVVTAGLSGGLGIIMGRLFGKGGDGSQEKLLSYSKAAERLSLLFGAFSALFMQGLKLPFLSLWNIGGTSSGFAVGFINVLSFLVIGTAYQSVILNGIIKSRGDVRFILKLEAFFVFCVIIPVSLLAASLGAPPILLFAILKCDQILKCPIAYLKLRKTVWGCSKIG